MRRPQVRMFGYWLIVLMVVGGPLIFTVRIPDRSWGFEPAYPWVGVTIAPGRIGSDDTLTFVFRGVGPNGRQVWRGPRSQCCLDFYLPPGTAVFRRVAGQAILCFRPAGPCVLPLPFPNKFPFIIPGFPVPGSVSASRCHSSAVLDQTAAVFFAASGRAGDCEKGGARL